MLRDYNTTYDEKGVGKNWTFYYINQTWYNSSVLKDPVKEYWELVSPLISFSFSVYLFLAWNDYDCCINDAEGSSWISNWSPRSFLSGYIQCIVFVQTRIWFMTDFGWIEFCLNVWMKIKSDWKLVKKKKCFWRHWEKGGNAISIQLKWISVRCAGDKMPSYFNTFLL